MAHTPDTDLGKIDAEPRVARIENGAADRTAADHSAELANARKSEGRWVPRALRSIRAKIAAYRQPRDDMQAYPETGQSLEGEKPISVQSFEDFLKDEITMDVQRQWDDKSRLGRRIDLINDFITRKLFGNDFVDHDFRSQEIIYERQAAILLGIPVAFGEIGNALDQAIRTDSSGVFDRVAAARKRSVIGGDADTLLTEAIGFGMGRDSRGEVPNKMKSFAFYAKDREQGNWRKPSAIKARYDDGYLSDNIYSASLRRYGRNRPSPLNTLVKEWRSVPVI